MDGSNRKDWEELNITKEEVETLKEALKKEEFRKLLAEYADEITDPKNRKQYQDEIIQLEAERGVDCTFVNPEPGFVVKTSADGKKKAFVNIAKSDVIGRPSAVPVVKDDSRGTSWSLPFSQSPGREDHDKKHNRCVVYDVVFHPDTLRLAEKSPQFKKLVVETALSAVEDSFKVKLDKKNVKFPKLKFKGIPFATVIRKKSKKQPILTEEEIEFQKKLNYPLPPPAEGSEKPVVRNFDTVKDKERYTFPKYVVKHRTGIDLQEFTYDKNGKINIAIPKELVIEVNLPLLSSTETVTLDVMEKSVHLLCEKPAKYKLDIQLPYAVNEEEGNAKFDKTTRVLVITLPVIKSKMTITDLIKDYGMEETNGDETKADDSSCDEDSTDEDNEHDSAVIECDASEVIEEVTETAAEESRTKEEAFLDVDKHYILPSHTCNVANSKLCFILEVKNVDPCSVVKAMSSNFFRVKFLSLGSGFYPIFYAFMVKFGEEHLIEEVTAQAWNDNVTVQVQLDASKSISSYSFGVDEASLTLKDSDSLLCLERKLEEVKLRSKLELEEDEDDDGGGEEDASVHVESADADEVVIKIVPKSKQDDAERANCTEEESSTPREESPQADDIILIPQGRDRICETSSESHEVPDAGSPDGEQLSMPRKTVTFSEHVDSEISRTNEEDERHEEVGKGEEDRPPSPERPLIEEVERNKARNCDVGESGDSEKVEDKVANDVRFRAKKDDKIFEFKSDLIFDLDL